MHVLTDDIVLVTDTHAPTLTENMTELFSQREEEDIYVILLEHLHVENLEWIWSKELIMQSAWIQRGYIAYDHLRWELAQMRGSGLPVPKGRPTTFHLIIVYCGGVPRAEPEDPMALLQDPKRAMHDWDQHKLQTHAPTILGPTTNMILKAEARTVSALMKSKSAAQTRQIMIATYRRAGLADPFQQLPQAPLPVHPPLETIIRDLHDLCQALHNQVETRSLGGFCLD